MIHEERIERPGRIEIWMDNEYISSIESQPVLYANIWTVADMVKTDRIVQIEQILDASPITEIDRVSFEEPIRNKANQFVGSLKPLVKIREDPRLPCYIMTKSMGKRTFHTDFELKVEGALVGARGIDYGYSTFLFRLNTPKLHPEDAPEFAKLFNHLCQTSHAFYGRATERSLISQREIFMARSAKNVGNRKKIPNFERELWDVYWLNYFGPAFVELWGESKLARLAEQYQVRRFENGGFCVQTAQEPPIADESAKGITDYAFKKHFYDVAGWDTAMHETHQPGQLGQYVPTMAQHRKALSIIADKEHR
jgi:hypothetical protein